ncbi:hypothetical protein FLJC2902T_10750 [Flavobacterium limnosediminis JC2902]|uniref:Uncharacterized protein n=1 Tax=Flavobacterium limnosediminis JC2902 TaxID=1341181 RepID=V6SX91_9FLAO|nr:hypothetical protein FLJC2902T_10750 [Flavobacterium limnosediminis JC2902]
MCFEAKEVMVSFSVGMSELVRKSNLIKNGIVLKLSRF